jgi:UDP-N-acetyl-D-mannosaminuronic acid dehydrogenase
MELSVIKKKIKNQTAKIAVIGLGYVGLPVACEFARVGFDVLGVDIIKDRVEQIKAGISPIEGEEPGLDELLKSVIQQGNLDATTDYSRLKDRDIVLIDVETPVDEDHLPKYRALKSVLEGISPIMKTGALVIVESTIAPLTMTDFVLPILEENTGKKLNQDFFLGNCPERVMPGKLLANLRTVSRVVGGMNPETAETMVALYSQVVDADLDPTDCITAELVKTTENAFRDVNIAFANEVALVCEVVGGDVWTVRELVNKSPSRNMHLPGAGVGGHCIPKDPWLLIANLDESYQPSLIPTARAINDSMPHHIVRLAVDALKETGVNINKSKIAVLGYAYLENSDDSRNSPSAALVSHLEEQGASVVIHDPRIDEFQGDLLKVVEGCHAIILMVKHSEYKSLDLEVLFSVMKGRVLIDGRQVFKPETLQNRNLIYRSIGISPNQ